MTTYAGGPRLERTILQALTGKRVDVTRASRDRMETSGGWRWGQPQDYDPEFLLDPIQLWEFLSTTQLTSEQDRQIVDLSPGSPTRQAFLTALRWEISYRGIADVMRRGMSYGSLSLTLFYGLSGPPPHGSMRLFRMNRFSVTPRLPYGGDETDDRVDLCFFLNGLPLFTVKLADGFEIANEEAAIDWYRQISPGSAKLFEAGRCLAHFAVDDQRVSYCANLNGLDSVFHPFNQGPSQSATNRRKLFGVPTEYLWRTVLTRRSVVDLIENYALIVATGGGTTGAGGRAAIFPHYHQLEIVRRLLADIDYYGVGRRYLIQHSQGSGKSQSMIWLISQIIALELVDMAMFGTVVIVTDRPSSDHWLLESVRQFSRVSAIVDAREMSTAHIEENLESPNRIILVNVKDFAFVLDEIKVHFHGYGYAIVIDETRSSTPESLAPDSAHNGSSMFAQGRDTLEDQVNRAMTARDYLPNASYFVFTSKPNEKTLELFGKSYNDRGTIKYRPFHQFGVSE